MPKLYSVDDVVVTCLACGAFCLVDRKPWRIKHYPGCGGPAEIEKWDRYYAQAEDNTDEQEVVNP